MKVYEPMFMQDRDGYYVELTFDNRSQTKWYLNVTKVPFKERVGLPEASKLFEKIDEDERFIGIFLGKSRQKIQAMFPGRTMTYRHLRKLMREQEGKKKVYWYPRRGR